MKFSKSWLSSQILLLVIAGWVIGLAIIHHTWLVPSIQAQLARQESSAAVRWIEQSLAGLARERKALSRLCREFVTQSAPLTAIRDRMSAASATASDAQIANDNLGVIVCDGDRRVTSLAGWLDETASRSRSPWRVGDGLDNSAIFPPAWSAESLTGLVAVAGRTCIFARESVHSSTNAAGFLVLLRPIDWPMLQDLSNVTGVNVMVVDSLRPGAASGGNSIEHWSADGGNLSATITLKDSLGRPIGQLQVSGSTIDLNSSAGHIRGAYMVQLLWLIGSALLTFGVVYLLFIRPLAILVRRLSDQDVTSKRDKLAAGLFAETGILALKFSDVMGRIVLLSQTDPLTGLTNRRQLQFLLDHEFHMSQRHNAPLAVLMIDVDYFKQVNDRFGHLLGDEVLVMVARTIQEMARRTDVCGRYGGEEFAIVLPRTSMDQAAVLGERIRTEIARRAVMHEQEVIRATVSIGVASMPQMACRRPEDLLNLADRALYAAKRTGRNRTVLASEMPVEPKSADATAPPHAGQTHPLHAIDKPAIA